MKQAVLQEFAPSERRRKRCDAAISRRYLFLCQGVFALYGQTIFYTKRVLENIEEKDIPAYLKEIGKMNLLLGVLFVGKACLDIPFPGSRPILYGWLLILLLCVFSISKIDTKYKKQ